jgi:hypothetical protein
MVKVSMIRRLDPMDRICALSDASVPFNFDSHALFFSNDAVGIEAAMHERLADRRVNLVNRRREFFRITPLEAKMHLAELSPGRGLAPRPRDGKFPQSFGDPPEESWKLPESVRR